MEAEAALDEPESDDRKALTRLCLVSRSVEPVSKLLRFVKGPDGALVPDLKRKLPGRGASITATAATLREALKRRVFARPLGVESVDGATLEALIDNLLVKTALDHLSLANKAGHVRAGTAKVEALIASGRVGVLLHAAESAADSKRKFAQALNRAPVDGGTRVIELFSGVQLDMALGRMDVVHAALAAGAVCNGFLDRVAALEFWRNGGLPEGARKPSSGGPSGGRNGETNAASPQLKTRTKPIATRESPEGSETE